MLTFQEAISRNYDHLKTTYIMLAFHCHNQHVGEQLTGTINSRTTTHVGSQLMPAYFILGIPRVHNIERKESVLLQYNPYKGIA